MSKIIKVDFNSGQHGSKKAALITRPGTLLSHSPKPLSFQTNPEKNCNLGHMPPSSVPWRYCGLTQELKIKLLELRVKSIPEWLK